MRVRTLWRVPVFCLLASAVSYWLTIFPGYLFYVNRMANADGSIEVLAVADIITKGKGGRGAVREAITMILAAQDNWEQIVNSYLTAGQGDKQ